MALGVLLLGASGDELAPQRPVSDTYFATQVTDPYRYMESNDPAYVAWKTAGLAATKAMLLRARHDTGFEGKAQAPKASPRLSSLTVIAGHAFYVKSSRAGDQLCERDVSGGAERIILESGRFDTKAGPGGLGAFAVSWDAKLIEIHVYSGDQVESDVHIVRVSDGSDVEAPLHGTIFDYVGFTLDNRQVLYAKPGKSTKSMSIPDLSYDVLHRLGTPQATDPIVFGTGMSSLVDVPPHAFAFVDPTAGTQVVAEVRDVAAGGSRFYTAPLSTLGKPETPWRSIGDASSAYTDYAVHGTTIDLVSSAGAPNFKVVRASLVGRFAPKVILPASDTVVVSGTLDGIPKGGIFALNSASDADYVQLLDRGRTRLVRIPWSPEAGVRDVPLPFSGSILEVATDLHSRGVLFEANSWTNAGDVYAYDPGRDTTAALRVRPAAEDATRVAEELTATASDGTHVAVSVIHRPGLALDGSHPLILRAAGAYGFSFTPDYRQVPDAWLSHGGVIAVVHARGGGELGEAWHRAGMGPLKSNTWNDVIAAAQRLIEAGYTSPKRLNLYGTTQSYLGGIASSIAIGRAIEERPDLFAAAVVDSPAFDLLRSERTGLGRQSTSEFGSVATAAGFADLQAMSPYEHVKPGVAYPTLLARSLSHLGLGDDWQAAKMVARLQAAAGRSDAAYLDILSDGPGDTRQRTELNEEAFAFFLASDATR